MQIDRAPALLDVLPSKILDVGFRALKASPDLHRTVNMLVQSREQNVPNHAKNRAQQHSALEMMLTSTMLIMWNSRR
jgi:hypothetical protein